MEEEDGWRCRRYRISWERVDGSGRQERCVVTGKEKLEDRRTHPRPPRLPPAAHALRLSRGEPCLPLCIARQGLSRRDTSPPSPSWCWRPMRPLSLRASTRLRPCCPRIPRSLIFRAHSKLMCGFMDAAAQALHGGMPTGARRRLERGWSLIVTTSVDPSRLMLDVCLARYPMNG